MTMLPDWLERANVFIWLCAAAVLLMAVSIIYDGERYMDLWFVSFLYGLFGFAASASMKEGHARRFILGALTLLFVVCAYAVRRSF